jgi:hypothetical protein
VAGSTGAYQFHGRSADGRVADISVISPQPACVRFPCCHGKITAWRLMSCSLSFAMR